MTWKGWEDYVPVVKDRHGETFMADPISKKRHKYGAVKTTVDGITFSSKKEATRYGELKALEKAGEITELMLQPSYELKAKRGGIVGIYRADFFYVDKFGDPVIEDVKGFKTPLYRWKKKHMEAQYGIEIHET